MDPLPQRPPIALGKRMVLPTMSVACQALQLACVGTQRQFAARGCVLLSEALHTAARHEMQMPQVGAMQSVSLACATIVQLLQRDPSAHQALVQRGSPAEWAATRKAIVAALPQRQRLQAAIALDTVSHALQLATPDGQAAAKRQAAAAAAADAAMHELLLVGVSRDECCVSCCSCRADAVKTMRAFGIASTTIQCGATLN